ncbi:MAG: flippase-like domain-containing protein [Candidatus Eisenbacteria bacterium]|uniref:Flippase-like domain-containing protein n=1 Tax=Eiseniibacteriota bacterium TaxID=2212470 RepID=A0A9D6L863_UNCEI|nr:flippase-like domain-containing protein [Candidatus Eisenbacteria bacterium]MBI3540506.1 flippase-like domain-containing protein [Candidatus Eisenbacteria bacterium]
MSAAPPRIHARHALLLGAKALVSAGLLVFLFRRIPLDQFAVAVRGVRPGWIVAAWLLLLGSNLLGAWQWSRLLRVVEIRIPFWKVCAYYHVGLFFNNFLPANIGGDIARVADSARHGPTRTAAVSAVLMDRLVGTLALASLALVTTLPAIDRFHLRLVYALVLVFFATSVVLVWAIFHPALLPACERLLARIGLGALGPHLDELAGHIADYRGERGLFARLFGIALVTQITRIIVHVLVARALAISVPWVYFFLFVPLLGVIVSLPISFNGIGVREGAGIVLFGLVGVDRAHAFSLQFLTYLVAVAVSMIGGLVFLARIPRRRAVARQAKEGRWT